MEPRMNTNKHE